MAREFVRALLNDEKAQGQVRDDVDVDQIALEVVATIMGARVPVADRPGTGRLRGAMETYIDELMARLAPT